MPTFHAGQNVSGVAANGHNAASRQSDPAAHWQHSQLQSKNHSPNPGLPKPPHPALASRSGHGVTISSDDGADFFADSPMQGGEMTSEGPPGDGRFAIEEAQAPLPGSGGVGLDMQQPRSQGSVSPFTAMSSSAPLGWGHDQVGACVRVLSPINFRLHASRILSHGDQACCTLQFSQSHQAEQSHVAVMLQSV